MTRQLLCLIIPFALLTGCMSTHCPKTHLSSISITDRNGFSETISNSERLDQYETVNFLTSQPYEKVLRVYNRDSHGNVRGELIAYHPNGQPMQYLQILNGRACGNYTSWHSNGTMNIQATIVEGEPEFNEASQQTWLFDGMTYTWDDDGSLIAEIPYAKGALEGDSTYYHPSGNIWKVISFHKNLLTGKSYTYLDNGDLLATAEYKNGVLDGPSQRWWTPDRLAAEEKYDKGILRFGDYYDMKGDEVCSIRYGEGYRAIFAKDYIIEQQRYLGGEQEGEIKVFDPEGFLLQTYHVKNGVKHGVDIEYYPESRGTIPRISTTWVEGELHGTMKTWYRDGIQESQREMNNVQKDGVLTAWYRDGSLMMIEEYEKDALLKGEYYRRDDSRPVSRVVKGSGTATLYDPEGNLTAKVTVKNGKPVL